MPVTASPVIDSTNRFHDAVDSLEHYLRLLQDECDGHFAPLVACKQHLDKLRRLAGDARSSHGEALSSPPQPVANDQTVALVRRDIDALLSLLLSRCSDPLLVIDQDQCVAWNRRCLELFHAQHPGFAQRWESCMAQQCPGFNLELFQAWRRTPQTSLYPLYLVEGHRRIAHTISQLTVETQHGPQLVLVISRSES